MSITFKQFMHEAAVGANPQYEERSFEQVIELLESNCSDAVRLIKKDLMFWRGERNTSFVKDNGFALADPSKTVRRSQNTSNYYTLMMDSNPAMTEFPKRSRSFIVSTDNAYAKNFLRREEDSGRETFALVPFNGVKIGVVPAEDIWEIDNVSVFGGRYSMTDFEYEFKNLGIDEDLSKMKKFHDLLKAGDEETISRVKEQFPKISDADMNDFMGAFWDGLNRSGFKCFTTADMPIALVMGSHEAWIGGKSLLVTESMWYKLVKYTNEEM